MAPRQSSQLIPRQSLSDAVYTRLRDEIMSGEIADGSRLSQVQLAERYGVSRIPVREALRRLQSEWLVVATPYHPFVVRKVTVDQIVELVDIRAALEDLALVKRAPLAAEEIAELRRLNRQMAQRPRDDFRALDREFHRLIGGPEAMVVEMIDDVRDRVNRYISSMTDSKPGRTTATEEHAKIIDALEADDRELARRLMHEHVMTSQAFILGRLGADSPSGDAAPGDRPAAARRRASRGR